MQLFEPLIDGVLLDFFGVLFLLLSPFDLLLQPVEVVFDLLVNVCLRPLETKLIG